jgi:hypothetical protein
MKMRKRKSEKLLAVDARCTVGRNAVNVKGSNARPLPRRWSPP